VTCPAAHSAIADRDRTVEVHCRNCGARFVAWYGAEEDAGTEVKEIRKCGLCGGDPFKKDNFKDVILRLIPYVTARNVKREYGSFFMRI
jgi:hypothetical protein